MDNKVEAQGYTPDYNKLFDLLKDEDLAEVLIVSKLNLTLGDDSVEVSKAKGELCPRCRKYHEEFVDADGLKVCERCAEALK
mgnify:CR=1 FL=1